MVDFRGSDRALPRFFEGVFFPEGGPQTDNRTLFYLVSNCSSMSLMILSMSFSLSVSVLRSISFNSAIFPRFFGFIVLFRCSIALNSTSSFLEFVMSPPDSFLPSLGGISRVTPGQLSIEKGWRDREGLILLTEQRVFGRRELGRIVAARKQMAIDIHRHHDRRMAEPLLHDLGGQLQAAIDARD